jgi:hypothetical protein
MDNKSPSSFPRCECKISPLIILSAIMQFMECPCEQFASMVENKLKNNLNVVRLDYKVMALTNLHFNQEFLFLQVLVL